MEELKCRVLKLLQQSWPYPVMISQVMHHTGRSEEDVNEALAALKADGEDIVHTPEPGGLSRRTNLQFRWRQPILESQIPEGQTSADPIASSDPLPGPGQSPDTSSAESTRSSGTDEPAGLTSDTSQQ